MSNKNRGEVSVRLDRVRKLRFDFNALAEFEELMGVSLLAAMQDFQQDDRGNVSFSFKTLRAMLWAGLLHEEPTLTVRQAGKLFELADGDDLPEKMAQVLPLITEAFVDRLGGEEAKKKLRAEMRGSQGGQTGGDSKKSPAELSA